MKLLRLRIALLGWLASVPVMTITVRTFTFWFSSEPFQGEETIVTAGNAVVCGGQCLLNPLCGAYAYRPTQLLNCVLVTKSVKKGNNDLPGLYFSGMSLSSGAYLIRAPIPRTDVRKHHARCEQLGSRLVLFPAVQKDLTATQSHGHFFYDLKRASETSNFTTNDGTSVNDVLVNVTGSSSFIGVQYMATRYDVLYRRTFYWNVENNLALCQYSQVH